MENSGSADFIEVLVKAAGSGQGLTLVFTPQRFGAVEPFRRGGQCQEGYLTNFHAVIEGYGQPGQVAQLQGQVPLPARVHEAGCGMDNQSDPPQGAFSFQPGHQVFRKLDMLDGAAQDELAGMQYEGTVLGNCNDFSQVIQAFLDIDIGLPGVSENQYLAVQMRVDTGRLNILGI